MMVMVFSSKLLSMTSAVLISLYKSFDASWLVVLVLDCFFLSEATVLNSSFSFGPEKFGKRVLQMVFKKSSMNVHSFIEESVLVLATWK